MEATPSRIEAANGLQMNDLEPFGMRIRGAFLLHSCTFAGGKKTQILSQKVSRWHCLPFKRGRHLSSSSLISAFVPAGAPLLRCREKVEQFGKPLRCFHSERSWRGISEVLIKEEVYLKGGNIKTLWGRNNRIKASSFELWNDNNLLLFALAALLFLDIFGAETEVEVLIICLCHKLLQTWTACAASQAMKELCGR